MKHNDRIKILNDAAEELRNIYRGKHYAFWREETAPRIHNALSGIEPFKSFHDVWIHTGDASYVAATARFGAWAIDRLLAKQSPEEVLEAFSAEIAQNATRYDDASPVFGVEIDETCELENGIVIVSEPTDELVSLRLRIPFQSLRLPAGTAVLKQAFAVKPAFELRQLSDAKPNETCATHPTAETRTASRNRVRLACLLASTGPVEFPVTTLLPDEKALFVAGEGNISARPFAARALVAFPVEAARIAKVAITNATHPSNGNYP